MFIQIFIEDKAKKDIKKLDKKIVEELKQELENFKNGNKQVDIMKLSGHKTLYRMKFKDNKILKDYRIIFKYDVDFIILYLIGVKQRKEAYKDKNLSSLDKLAVST